MVVGVGGKGKVVYSNWGVEGGIYNMCMVIVYLALLIGHFFCQG